MSNTGEKSKPNSSDYLRLAQLYNSYQKSKQDQSELQKDRVKIDRLPKRKVYSTDNASRIIKRIININYQIPEESFVGLDDRQLIGFSPLHLAVIERDLNSVKTLLNRGANFTVKCLDGQTPLHKAIEIDKEKLKNVCPLINAILNAHLNTKNISNPFDNYGMSHFHIACMVNNLEAVEFFLKAGVSVNQAINIDSPIFPKYTPLHFAVEYSCLETIQILLKYEADMNLKNARGMSPLYISIENNRQIIDRMNVRKQEFDLQFENNIRINEKIIVLLFKNGNKNVQKTVNDIGLTNLHIFCTFNDHSIATNYLQEVININASIKKDSPIWPGYTASHFAAHFNIKTVEMLIKNGANVAIKDANGVTPLDLCLDRYKTQDLEIIFNVDSVQSFLENGKNIAMKDFEVYLGKCKLSVISKILSAREKFKNIISNEAFEQFIIVDEIARGDMKNLVTNINATLPFDSILWPGYSILHLAVVLVAENKQEYLYQENSIYLERIKICLSKGASVTLKNTEGYTPIHLAFQLYQEDIVKLLLDSQYYQIDRNTEHVLENPTNPDGLSHFHISCVSYHSNMVRKFLENGESVNSKVKNDFKLYVNTPWSKNENKLVTIKSGSTPMHIAVITEDSELLDLLIDENADPNIKDSDGLTPIHLTSKLGTSKEMNGTLLYSENIQNSITDNGISHLHIICSDDDGSVAHKILSEGANVNSTIKCSDNSFLKDETPLHVAVDHGNCNMIRTLIQHGANIHQKNSNGKSPLEYGIESDYLRNCIFNTFKSNYREDCGFTQLHLACATLDENLARDLLESGADVNAQVVGSTFTGWTPMHILFEFGNSFDISNADQNDFPEFIALLLKYGSDINIRNSENETPIHVAVKKSYQNQFNYRRKGWNFIKIVYWLLQQTNSHTNLTDKVGLSYFHLACCNNDTKIVEKYLKHGSDVNQAVDPFSNSFEFFCGGYTPLHFAVSQRCEQVVEILLNYGANVKAEDSTGNTPLHIAAKYGLLHERYVEMILRMGADINAENIWGEKPFELIFKSRNEDKRNSRLLEYIRLFIKYKCQVNSFNSATSEGLIAIAISELIHNKSFYIPHIFISAELIAIISAPNVMNLEENNRNAIQNIVAKNNECNTISSEYYTKVIERLLVNGCDIDHQDIQGRTALHIATEFQNFEAIKSLLLLGADINIVDQNSKSPFSYSVNSGNIFTIANSFCIHINKLRFTELPFVDQNFNHVIENIYETNFDVSFPVDYTNESKKMENCKISKRLTLRDFLCDKIVHKYEKLSAMDRKIVDNYFKRSENVNRKFPELGCLLIMQYRKAYKRFILLKLAMDAWIFLDSRLHDVSSTISDYLKIEDLQNFVDAMEK